MEFKRFNYQPLSPDELEDINHLKIIVERAVADGKLSKQEMECIKIAMRRNIQITFEKLVICREHIWDKIQTGELEYSWW